MAQRVIVAVLVLLSCIASANARPLLAHASPAAGSATPRSPSHIVLSFTEVVSPSGSDAVVRSTSGAVVSSGKARVVGNKAQLEVPVKSLSPGKYRVEWYVTSADRHQNQGSFNFIVGSKETVGRGAAERHHRRKKD